MGYLDTWTIYERPTDYPEHFVVRAWRVEEGRPLRPGRVRLADTLDHARQLVPIQQFGLHRIERSPDDDATIVETWV